MQEASVVVLRKVKRFAPDFHQHIVKGQAQGSTVQKGDRMLVYEIQETVPEGPVLVTDNHTV
ncbi:MAG: hypothetical protein M1358_03280 [Chloroflexi bacterium]|nr:hypothetical protein [Chloroflexota bacterium]